MGSYASFVAVEGCDMKHVAVCAHSDGLHLAISRQWSRVGGAARAEDLKRQSMKCVICTVLVIFYQQHNMTNIGIQPFGHLSQKECNCTFPQLLQ